MEVEEDEMTVDGIGQQNYSVKHGLYNCSRGLDDDSELEENADEGSEADNESMKRKISDDEDDLSDRLEDDDYDLIEENLGVKLQRKKFKRLRRIEEDSDDEAVGDNDDREAIANQLFEGSDIEDEPRSEPIRQEVSRQYESEESEGDYSETDDFIVDDEGQPIKEVRKRQRHTFSDATLQQAHDIFGVDFDYEEFDTNDDEHENFEEYADELDDRGDSLRRSIQSRQRKSVYEVFEPQELDRAGYTDKDNQIRLKDMPERMQLRNVPVVNVDEDELSEETEWIYTMAFKDRNVEKETLATQRLSYNQNSQPVPQPARTEWAPDWDKQTVVSDVRPTAIRQAPPEEEDWEEPSTTRIGASIPRPTVTVVDDENWEDLDWSGIPAPRERTEATTESSPSREPIIEISPEEVKVNLLQRIRTAISYMRNKKFEVPYIAFYRKDSVLPVPTIYDLWNIFRLDARFCTLKERRTKLIQLFRNMLDYQSSVFMAKPDEPILDSIRLITEDDIERIKSVNTTDAIRDAYLFFSLHFADDVIAMKVRVYDKRKEQLLEAMNGEKCAELEIELLEGELALAKKSVKLPVGGGAYRMFKKLGLEAFVQKFGLSSEKFAENLRDKYQRHEVDQCPTDPVEVAKTMRCGRLKTPTEVIKAAKFMMATQIAREPLVRQCVREVFFERATVSCSPTKKGQLEIDEAHPCYPIKFLKNKAVKQFKEDEFLKLASAEDDRLLTLAIGTEIEGITVPTYIEEVKHLFQKDEFSKNAQDWNNMREECLQFAFEKLLYPDLRKELRSTLINDAREHVMKFCAGKLHMMLKVAPYQVTVAPDENETEGTIPGIRVLAIAHSPDFEQSSFACMLSSSGEPQKFLSLQNLKKSTKSRNEVYKCEKLADLLALKEFIGSTKPHVIVVGGECIETNTLRAEVKEIVEELHAVDEFPKINVEILDNHPAKIYAQSLKSASDFPDYPMMLKQAISLGRRIQDPLLEYSQLCNPDNEILNIQFHPLQDLVTKEELLHRLQIEFINRVNEVGVDVNRAVKYPHTAGVVQFIGGFGPRKANGLLRTMRLRNSRLENRTQLTTSFQLGANLVLNAGGFIKIDHNTVGDNTECYLELLDRTRIHPESYEWAKKMAVDAIVDGEADDNLAAGAVEECFETPDKLHELRLDVFAEELERQGYGKRNTTLYDIRQEFFNPYKELRVRYESPSTDEIFSMLTRETTETFYIGKLVTATVIGIKRKAADREEMDKAYPIKNELTQMWVCMFCGTVLSRDLTKVWVHFDSGECLGKAVGISIRLDNGVTGFIPTFKISDSQITNPEDRVRIGQVIHCRIVKLDVDEFFVECTSRTSDLVDKPGEWKPKKDPLYDHETAKLFLEKEEEQRERTHSERRQVYTKRVIVHPSFRNVSYLEAEKNMELMEQGDVILRPSSKGPNHLTVTWKVADGVCQHIDVKEEGKEHAFGLGQSLWIVNDQFEDLDEIIARHVNPMASNARDIINYKYYLPTIGDCRQKAHEYLTKERSKNPKKIHYIFHASRAYPGKFILSYLPKNKSVHELITVNSEGFRFRQHEFDTLEDLLRWFKIHFRDPSTSMPYVKNVAPRTPFQTIPGYEDKISRLRAPPQCNSSDRLKPAFHATPHYTTPDGFTPYSNLKELV